MRDYFLDIIGGVLWVMVFMSPVISTFLVWRFLEINKVLRILFGIMIGLIASMICYFASLEIIFRNGIGPG